MSTPTGIFSISLVDRRRIAQVENHELFETRFVIGELRRDTRLVDISCQRLLALSIEALRDDVKGLEGTHRTSLDGLLPRSFMTKYTDFDSLESMVGASGFEVGSQADLDGLGDKWNKYIKLHTAFASWETMLEAAAKEWVTRRLGIGSHEE